MEGVVVHYRRGKHVQYTNQIIIHLKDITTRELARSLVGKKVVYVTKTGKQIVGVIKAPHGNSGNVRAIFEKGLPGQCIGKKVMIE
ncbi:MAG: 50S ribosomal protein L35ae [Candidatus Woesearchaeota archaeon]